MIYKTIYPCLKENRWQFNLWAPKAKKAELILEEKNEIVPMEEKELGYWYTDLQDLPEGSHYKYRINEGESFPDPASLSQPGGVHGSSELVNLQDFKWTDSNWKNIPLESMIQYELHTGTFSPSENFEGIISKIPHLKELGINAIEILPVSQFSGRRNWGYDGVYPFAVHDSYGGPKQLMKLVNECHNNGLAVILDVVYNHFGPEGNYSSQYGYYFSGKYSTPWGKPVNFDGAHSDGVRNFVVQNALMWCRDFHIDGLRLDAVHAIYDFSAKHIMQELAENLKQLEVDMNRKFYLIAESNLNDVRYINSIDKGGYGLHAQWSDDFHHSIHTLTTGENKGYYLDFGAPDMLSKSIKDAFVYDGRYSDFRKKSYGNSTKNNPGSQFVIFNQNHDQTGNRKFGERLISLTDFETAKLIAATMLVSPNVPMLFMGEEYGERNPFYYFVSHEDPYLNEMVRKGRSEEFKDFYDDNLEAPDPSSEDTFNKSQLSWNIKENEEKTAMFAFYKSLIKLRKENPVLSKTDKDNLTIDEKEKCYILIRWQNDNTVVCLMNFSDKEGNISIPDTVKGNLVLKLDSDDKQFKGTGIHSQKSIKAGDKLTIPAKTFSIYSN